MLTEYDKYVHILKSYYTEFAGLKTALSDEWSQQPW